MIVSGSQHKWQSYVDSVLDGDQVACALVQAACQRHVRDMERQETDDFPFYFDASHASHAIDFFETCLKHSIGDSANKPFLLEPWQAFAVASIIGWKRIDDGSRRFRSVYLSMARKNGKSTFAAGLSLFMAALDCNPTTCRPESVAQVFLSATKRDQARVVYDEVVRMRKQSPTMEKISDVKNQQVNFSHNGGRISMLASDKDWSGLNPHCCVVDELHAFTHSHRDFFNTMKTGGANRVQPILLMITTAGNDKSLLWQEEFKYAEAIALGNVKDETFFTLSFQLDEKDDPFDEDTWIKANPNLGVSVKLDFLRSQATEAKVKPLAKLAFIQYHGNRLVSSTERAFDMEEWDACEAELSDWEDADAITAAVDLGSRDDFASYGLCARFVVEDDGEKPIYRYEIKAKAYIAEDTTRDLTEAPFQELIYNEQLVLSRYPVLQLRDDLIADCEEYNVTQIGYDPAAGQMLGERLKEEGLEAIRIGQNCSQFNEPIRELLLCIHDGRLTHTDDPLLRWCASNAVLIKNARDHYMYDKASSKQKIDPIVAVTMAFRLATLAPETVQGGFI